MAANFDENCNKEMCREMLIEELDLSVRSFNCLKRAGINTVAELVQRNMEDMMKVRNLGKKSLEEVEQKLAALGLALKLTDDAMVTENVPAPIAKPFEERSTEEIMAMRIEESNLSFSIVSVFKHAGFRTIADIVQYIQQYGIDGLKYISFRIRQAFFERLQCELSVLGIKLEYQWPESAVFVPSGLVNDFEIEGTTLKKYIGTNPYVRIPYGIRNIDWHDFNRNGNVEIIETLKLPPTLRKIGDFSGCKI